MNKEIEMEGERSTMELQALPEGCIANILSHTTPVDACRLSLLCKPFCSAAESDTVWDRFIPTDFLSIVSTSQSASSLLTTSPSKKSLYLTLSDHPIVVQSGTESFQLDKWTGKKCYMVSARELSIIWGGSPQYWDWRPLPGSRFQEVAWLRAVCWFEIGGRINTGALSSNTHYVAFLVFEMIDASGFHYCPVELSIGILGGENCSTKNVCLDPSLEDGELDDRFLGLEIEFPKGRSDGFWEIEIGEFYNSGLGDEVHIQIKETTSNMWKHGFILEGIEVRPKNI